MKVRLGYVCIALKLKNTTSSSPVTFKSYNKIISEEEKLNKLKKVTLSNLNALKNILNYNIKNDIHFYRITSNLVPLATHPDVTNWNYRKIFKAEFEEIGNIIKSSNMRVDTHPDQFNVINSLDENVVNNTKRNLYFHIHLFNDLNYNGQMVLHVGSGASGKEKAIDRFCTNFKSYPDEITSKIILENDDKTFTAKDVLKICQTLSIPMVLDIHHHNVKNDNIDIRVLLPDIIKTWDNNIFPPKYHISSPKDDLLDRKHADFIDCNEFIKFIDTLREFNIDADIMLEAKKKDLALCDLILNLHRLRPDYKWIDKTTFIVE